MTKITQIVRPFFSGPVRRTSTLRGRKKRGLSQVFKQAIGIDPGKEAKKLYKAKVKRKQGKDLTGMDRLRLNRDLKKQLLK